jgi:hypothetical protein
MLNQNPLTATEAEQIIAQLDAIADRLFEAGNNFLGNQVQEVAYCVEANLAEAEESDGQPTEQEEWASFDPDC